MKNRKTDKYNGSKHFKIGENQINPLTGRIIKVGSQKFNKLYRRYGDEALFKMMNNYNPDKYRDSKNFEIREEHKNPLTGRIITVGSQTFNKLYRKYGDDILYKHLVKNEPQEIILKDIKIRPKKGKKNTVSKTNNDDDKHKVLKLPMKSISLNTEKKSETKLAGLKQNDPDASFVNLFAKRLLNNRPNSKKVNIEIFGTFGGRDGGDKGFNPVEVEMPWPLPNDEIYRFGLYIYQTKFSNAYRFVIKLGLTIVFLENVDINGIRMGNLRFNSALIDALNGYKILQKPNQCVQDYIWEMVKNQPGFKRYVKKQFTEEFNKFISDVKKRPSTKEIVKWRDECHTNVSIYGIDPFFQRFVASPAPHAAHGTIKIAYMVKDNHCYPILNEKVLTSISRGSPIMKNVEMYKWSDKCDKIYACKDLKDFNNILRNKINVDDHVVILPSKDEKQSVLNYMLKSMEETTTYPEYFHFNACNMLDGFLSQNMKSMFVASNEFDDRKRVCDTLYELYPNDKFIFHNQTFTNMAVDLFNCMFGYFPESVYNEETIIRLDEFAPKALQDCFIKFNEGDLSDENFVSYDPNYVCFDYAKNYSSILINNKCDFPIYTIHNKIEKYDGNELRPGEYFIDRDIIIPFKTENGNPILLPKGVHTKNAIEKLLNYNLITKNDIKYMLLCDKSLKADSFKNYIIFLFNTFEEGIAKKMANNFIGYFGTKYERTSMGYMTTSVENALASWSESYTENANCTINTCKLEDIELFLVRYISQKRKLNDFCSINRAIVCDSNLLLIDMMYDVCNKNSTIISINTDSVCVRNPTKTYPSKLKTVKYPVDQIGKIFVEDKEPFYFEKVYSNKEMNFDAKLIKPGHGYFINGLPGCGKTSELISDVLKCENPKVFCPTNNACKVIRNRLPDDKKNLVSTFDSFFNTNKGDDGNLTKLKNKTVFIDEYSMVPNKWITMLYKAYKKYNIVIRFYGDSNQCDPVDEVSYDYLKSPAILEMCPNMTSLNYIKDSARYDEKTRDMLLYFLENSKINETFNEVAPSTINLCYLNKTRIKVNQLCANWYMSRNKVKQHVEVKFNSKETYKLCNGMPVMCTDNIKKQNMMNSEQYTIQEIDSDKVLIKENNVVFPLKEFKEKFILAFCVTVHKYQGGEINTHYNIFDVGIMDKKILYTALSRTKKFDYIHLYNKELRQKYRIRMNTNHKVTGHYQNEYKDGKIYKIEFANGLIYIGCTINSTEERLKEHLFDTNSVVYKNKQYKPTISLVCNYPCHSKEELESCETFYINKYAKLYKDKVLNKRMNDEKKPKKIVSFKCNIMSNEDFNNKIVKKFVIKDNVKDRSFEIQYREGGERVKIKKRYNKCCKDEARDYMQVKQQELIDKYLSYNK